MNFSIRLRTFIALIVFGFITATSFAHEYHQADIFVYHPYTPPTPPGATVAAGYMSITNHGDKDDRLVSGFTDIAERVELHQTTFDGDVMRMRPLTNGVKIPAGETVVLASGGMHLMLVGLKQELVSGSRYKATLTFQHAGEVDVELVVEAVADQQEMDHSKM